MEANDLKPDPDLTEEQKALISSLSDREVQQIDSVLLSNTREGWSKMAMIVAITMNEHQFQNSSVPDIYYAMRIRKLVETGVLESQGFIENMRYCEVRRPVVNI
ncbi:MAG: DUF3658 domain-containing protein [Candidatus Thiodiazotropha sp. (ex Monitilora ramsayi)]|nr:DUF3658 domain-containing protein [Candidatus Thiodiazotropha sp. (ex Monitilora ramsayi)]